MATTATNLMLSLGTLPLRRGAAVSLLGLLVCLGLVGGCATPPAASAEAAGQTLGTNPQAPQRLIAQVYGDAGWHTLKDIPYDGWVILEGRLSEAGEVKNLRVKQAFPDERRVALAKALTTHVHLAPVGVGTLVRQRAEVHCYFYEQTQQQPEALVVAWRDGGVRATSSADRADFVGFVNY